MGAKLSRADTYQLVNLIEHFEGYVFRYAQSVALQIGDESVRKSALDQMRNQLADRLQACTAPTSGNVVDRLRATK